MALPAYPRSTAGSLLAVLATLLLAACSPAEAGPTASATRPLADAPSGGVDDGPPFDQLAETDAVDVGARARVEEATADLEGRPVVLTIGEDGVLNVVRATVPPDGRDGWPTVALPGLASFGSATSVTGTPGGTVLVTGYMGSQFALLQVDEAGQVTTTTVVAGLDPAQVRDATSALSPDGTVLYIGYTEEARAGTRVLAVNPATGAVLATAAIGSGGLGAGHVVGLTVSPAGDRVLLTQQNGVAPAIPRAILTSFGMDLRVLSQVALTDELTASRPLQLAADETGTAYVTVVVDEALDAEVRLVAVPAAATAATPVAAFEQLDDVTALAVDRTGLWAYVGGLASPSDPLSPTITPVDLRTGKPRFPVAICARGELTDIAVPLTGDGLLVTGRCADTGFQPTVWILR